MGLTFWDRFRDLRIAAQLKPSCTEDCETITARFRDLRIAAQLKLGLAAPSPRPLHRFRDLRIAAQLKPSSVWLSRRTYSSFPRSKDRGPIEAQVFRILRPRRDHGFRDLRIAAQLKRKQALAS